MAYARVPVKINGQNIGWAMVRENGSIEMTLPPSLLGSELYMLSETAMCEGINMTTAEMPAFQREPITEANIFDWAKER